MAPKPTAVEKQKAAAEASDTSNKRNHPTLGDFIFFSNNTLNKYQDLGHRKPTPVHPIDLQAFSKYPLHELFKYQGLKEFLVSKYQNCYHATVKQFYANLTQTEEDGVGYLKTLVHGYEVTMFLGDVYRALGWSEEEITNSANYVDITKQDSLEDIQWIQEKPDLTQVDLLKSLLKEGATYSKKKTTYGINLLPLARVINHILTYNLYPIKNHTELTYETSQLLYCIVNKVPIQWGIFIFKQMLSYQSDPPYDSLICKYLDSILPQSLTELGYLPSRVGYTITMGSLQKMGLRVNVLQ